MHPDTSLVMSLFPATIYRLARRPCQLSSSYLSPIYGHAEVTADVTPAWPTWAARRGSGRRGWRCSGRGGRLSGNPYGDTRRLTLTCATPPVVGRRRRPLPPSGSWSLTDRLGHERSSVGWLTF